MPKTPTKHTEEFALTELLNMLKEVKADKNICYIKELLEERDYTHQRVSEWIQRYPNNRQITDTYKKIHSLIEWRVFDWALKNKLNPTMAIFWLKCNYKWKEPDSVIKHKHELVSKAQLKGLSDDQLIELMDE